MTGKSSHILKIEKESRKREHKNYKLQGDFKSKKFKYLFLINTIMILNQIYNLTLTF